MFENALENLSKIGTEMVEHRFYKQAEVKKKESVITNNPLSFSLYFSCWSGSNIDEKTVKTSAQNESEFKYGFEVDFLMIFLGFRSISGPKVYLQFEKTKSKNVTILRWSWKVVLHRTTLAVPLGMAPWTTTMTRPIGLNNIISSRSMFGIWHAKGQRPGEFLFFQAH